MNKYGNTRRIAFEGKLNLNKEEEKEIKRAVEKEIQECTNKYHQLDDKMKEKVRIIMKLENTEKAEQKTTKHETLRGGGGGIEDIRMK